LSRHITGAYRLRKSTKPTLTKLIVRAYVTVDCAIERQEKMASHET